MQIPLKNTKIKEKMIYSESEDLIIGILTHFLHFKMTIACLGP